MSTMSASRAGLSGVARGSAANLLGAVVSAASTLGLTLAVTRGLPQGSAGVFFAVTSLFLLAVSVAQLGTDTGLVYFLSRARSLGRTHTCQTLYRTATRPVVTAGLVVAVVFFALAPQLSELVNPEHLARSTTYLRMTSVFIPLAALENVTLAGTRGMGTMRPNVLTEQFGRPMLQLLLVCVSLGLFGGRGVSLAWGFAYLPAAVMALLFWRRVVTASRQRADRAQPTVPASADIGPSEGSAREFWRFTGPRAAAGVAQMAMQRLDIVLVAALAGAVPAAIYTASTRFLVVGQMGQRAISLAVQPRIGEALAARDLVVAKQLYRVSTSWLMLVTWPIYLTFILFGERLLSVFGDGYDAGRTVLLLLATTMLVATGCGMVDMVLNMAGRTSWNLMNVLLSLGAQIGVDLWLIPGHGILGAAIGWSTSILLANLVPLVQVGLILGLHPFGRSTLVTVALTVTCFGVVPAVVLAALGDGWWSIVLSLAAGSAAYAAALWRFRGTLHLIELAHLRRRRTR